MPVPTGAWLVTSIRWSFLERSGFGNRTVFVDDTEHNLEPARALGLTIVHHTDAERTLAELHRLFADALNQRGKRISSALIN